MLPREMAGGPQWWYGWEKRGMRTMQTAAFPCRSPTRCWRRAGRSRPPQRIAPWCCLRYAYQRVHGTRTTTCARHACSRQSLDTTGSIVWRGRRRSSDASGGQAPPRGVSHALHPLFLALRMSLSPLSGVSSYAGRYLARILLLSVTVNRSCYLKDRRKDAHAT